MGNINTSSNSRSSICHWGFILLHLVSVGCPWTVCAPSPLLATCGSELWWESDACLGRTWRRRGSLDVYPLPSSRITYKMATIHYTTLHYTTLYHTTRMRG
ncbi:hypothetical protein F5X98DRAFT_247105 [Xylaria grammica]|nr:hypothetical protein F5X98DRAFT_247105 [Xylaria grammica]